MCSTMALRSVTQMTRKAICSHPGQLLPCRAERTWSQFRRTEKRLGLALRDYHSQPSKGRSESTILIPMHRPTQAQTFVCQLWAIRNKSPVAGSGSGSKGLSSKSSTSESRSKTLGKTTYQALSSRMKANSARKVLPQSSDELGGMMAYRIVPSIHLTNRNVVTSTICTYASPMHMLGWQEAVKLTS